MPFGLYLSEDRSDFYIDMLIRPTLEKIVAAAITP